MEQRRLLFRDMREVLASLYEGKESARTVAIDAGLDTRWINFEGNAFDRWRAILNEAERNQRVPVLLEIALHQYAAEQGLRNAHASYLAWVAAGRPLRPRERQLQTLADTYHLTPPDDGAAPILPGLLPRLDEVLHRHTLFGGRTKELARLDTFLVEQPNGYLLVTGPSGFGKTALLVNWIKALQTSSQSVCYHFISRAEDMADQHMAMQNLCEQMAAYHGLRGTLPTSEATLRALYPQLVKLPMEPGQKLVVVLDGLDEAHDWTLGADLFPPDLPEGMYVVFSARAEPNIDWLTQMGILHGAASPLVLKTMGHAEIKSLLQAAGGRATKLSESPDFVMTVYDISHGDPLYLHFLVQDILDGDITETNIKNQPNGLDQYLEKWWIQLSNDVNIKELYDLLGILSVAKGRLLPKDFAGISPNLRKGALLKKELSGKLRRYLSGDQNSGYALAHPRFGKYITEQQFNLDEVQEYLDQLLDYCARWNEHRSAYVLAYYARHLADAVEQSEQHARREFTVCLVKLTSDPSFQGVHMSVVDDLPALQSDLMRALKAAAGDQGAESTPLVIESALALLNFRARELRPEAIFALARQGSVDAARRRLDLFDVEFEWHQASLLMIAWLAMEPNEVAARELFETAQPDRPEGDPLRSLWDWVSAALRGTAPPEVTFDPPPPEDQVRAAVERMKGSGDTELLYRGGFGTMGVSELGYLTKEDGPLLVAFAREHPQEGDEYLDEYVQMHTGYNYVYYRNRSLWILLDAVIRHPSAEWIRGSLEKLTVAALAGSRMDFREGLPIAVEALRSRQTGQYDAFEGRRGKAVADAQQLRAERRSGDIAGDHKRRLAALAEALARLLNRSNDAHMLLQQTLDIPYGFAGYGMPAYLAVAEAMRVCDLDNHTDVEHALSSAQDAAHNIQDDTYCARITARWNAMRLFWWPPVSVDDLPAIIARLCDSPSAPDFAALHRVGESYDRRIHTAKLPLPPTMRMANTLQTLADVYKRPVTEFQRLNRKQGWAVDQELAHGTLVYVPDPGFATFLAARFAAEVLVDPTLSPQVRRKLIQSLVPVAAANPTTLDTVLARMLLADPPSAPETLAELERLSSYPTGSSGDLSPPYGMLS